jgi:hypothetical protein
MSNLTYFISDELPLGSIVELIAQPSDVTFLAKNSLMLRSLYTDMSNNFGVPKLGVPTTALPPVWNSVAMPSSSDWASIAYGNNLFMAIGTGTVAAISLDGITWTAITLPAAGTWSVAFGAGVFVILPAMGGGTTAYTSPDGQAWTSCTIPASGYSSVAFGAGVFCAVSNSSTAIATSPDGKTWTAGTGAGLAGIAKVTYTGSLFLHLQTGSGVYTSSTGLSGSWVSRALGATATWSSVAYGAGLYVAISNGGTSLSTSPDGVTWTLRSITYSGSWTGIVYQSGLFIVLPTGATVSYLYSLDGLTWTPGTMPICSNANGTSLVIADKMLVSIQTGTAIALTSGLTDLTLMVTPDTGDGKYTKTLPLGLADTVHLG